MQNWFANQSCDAFTAEEKPCTLGNYVSYAVKVSNARQVAAAVQFASYYNIRLVVRNTAHEYVSTPDLSSITLLTLSLLATLVDLLVLAALLFGLIILRILRSFNGLTRLTTALLSSLVLAFRASIVSSMPTRRDLPVSLVSALL